MGALSYEAVMDVLTCLTNCSAPVFMKLFDFLLQQAKAKAFDTFTHEENTLHHGKTILSKDVDSYHSLCTAGKWHVSNKLSGHFNVVCIRKKDVQLTCVLIKKVKKR